jgi:hypothetical protein
MGKITKKIIENTAYNWPDCRYFSYHEEDTNTVARITGYYDPEEGRNCNNPQVIEKAKNLCNQEGDTEQLAFINKTNCIIPSVTFCYGCEFCPSGAKYYIDNFKKFSREYILCAAIHYDDGKKHEHQPRNIKTGIVIAGRRHHNCIMTAHDLSKGILKQKTQVQGFITNTDKFVDRKEAFQIAKKARQFLMPIVEGGTETLISEDLW